MKIKRKALSVLSCLALIASSLPSTTVLVSGAENKLTEPGNPQYVTINGTGTDQGKTKEALFANGTDITVTYNAKTQSNTVTYTKKKEDGSTVEAEIEGVATTADIFAGCHGSSTAVGNDGDPVEITIDGAHLNTVYGGGLHESTVNNVIITVKGDAQLQWVCGGGANALIHDTDCQSGAWESDAANSKTVVNKAEINIEKGTVSQAVYGGGQGNSKTVKTTINIKDGTIDDVFASGSNGKTESAEVNISGGNIQGVSSVNRGTIDNADVNVSGGEIENLYIGAHSDYSSSTGTVTGANVNITGGTVKELHAGKSNNETLDVAKQEYSFSANPSSVEKYNEDIQEKKDKENAYYYYDVYLNNDEKDNLGNSAANKLDKIVNVVKGSNQKDYQVVYVVANGYKVEATDVVEDGAWKATKITCEDGSYVKTNYDIVNLFGGKHNDDSTTVNGDITLDGTTHVKYVFGGGWHKSSTGTAKVTIKNNAEVYRVQGGASSFLSYDNANCGVEGCDGCNYEANKNKECWKPNGDPTTADYVEAKARVESAEVIIDGCKNSYSDPISGTTLKTIVYGGGESYAYTGSATVTVKSGTVETVYAAGSNGNTATAEANVEGGTVNSLASAKSGKVGEVTVNVKGGAVKELVVGAHANVHGMASVDSAKVTVSGGTVTKVIDGDVDQNGETKNTETNKEKYDIVADGGTITEITGSIDSSAAEYGEAGNIDCHHDKYAKLEETKGTPATCQAAGTYDYFKCDNCHRYISHQEGVYQDVTNEQGDGVDNSKLTMEAGPTHHVFLAKDVVAKVEPTCTDTGKEAYAECSVCHEAYAKAIDAGEGNYTFEEVENEEALTIKALGHDNEEIEAIEATCTQNGRTSGVKCKRCNAILVPPVLTDLAEHTYGQEIAEVKATCKDAGKKAHYQCSVCKKLFTKSDEVYTEVTDAQLVIPATNEHTWGAYTYNDDATCTENGTETAECSVCHKKDTREKAETAKGHTISEEMIPEVPATCTDDGVMAHYKCTECDALFIDEVVEEETVKKEVTAEQLVIKAEGHKAVEDAEVKATCTSTGLTAGSHCDVCGAILKDQLATPMIPHTEKVIDAVAPTCTQFGWSAGSECAVCHGVLTVRVVVPALGHDYKDGFCTRCGEKDPNFTTNPTNPTNPTGSSTVQPTTKVPANVSKLTQAKVTKLKVKSKAKNKVNISWKKVANAKGYVIEVSKSNTFKKSAKVLKKNTKKLKLTIKNKKLKSKKTYYVRVRAYTTYKAADGSTKKAYSKWNVVLRKVKIK